MARIVSDAANNAIENNVTYKLNSRVTIYQSRNFFDASQVVDHSPSFAHSDGSGNPLPEAVTFNQSAGRLYTLVIESGQLKILQDGSNSVLIPLIDGSPIISDDVTRPAITSDGFVYYWDGTNWVKASYDYTKINALDTSCIGDPSTFVLGSSVPRGAIYVIGANEAVIFYIDDSAVRVAYIDPEGTVHKSDGRFFYPTQVLDPTVLDTYNAFSVHFAGAVKWMDTVTSNYKIYCYFSAWNGLVAGMYYEIGSNYNGIWSEIFTAIPEDISNFAIANVAIYNNRIWITGRFTRRSDFASNAVYTLVCWSTDGKTFTLDRRTLVTTIDYRWRTIYDPITNTVYFCSTNRIVAMLGAYQFSSTMCASWLYHLKSIQGSAQNGWNAMAVSGREIGFACPFLDEGSYAFLEIGVAIGSDFEWIPYHDCVISQVQWNYGDAVRSLQISIIADGLWHSQNMTYPIYSEIIGKEYLFSPLKVFDTLYAQTGLQGQPWALMQDPWTSDLQDGYTAASHSGLATDDVWCADLEESCSTYPTFGTDDTYQFNIYGWSRAGVLSQNPNVADTTPTNTLNDSFYALLLIQDLNGNQQTIVSTVDKLTSSYINPPQTWFEAGARAGSYPISFNIPNPGEGWQIIQLGVRVMSDSGNTTYFIERVEMPGIIANYTPTADTTGFQIQQQPPIAPDFNITRNDLSSDTGLTNKEIAVLDFVSGQSANEKYFTFTTSDDGKTHSYHIIMSNKLVYHDSYYGGYSPNGLAIVAESFINLGSPHNPPDGYILSGEVTITLPPNTSHTFRWNTYCPYPASVGSEYSLTIESIPDEGGDVDGIPTSNDVLYEAQNVTKGIPQILFATEPYSAWNFDIKMRSSFTGQYSYIGGIGMATDQSNFLVGYIKRGAYGIAKVRNQIRTIIYEVVDAGLIDDTNYDFHFWHRDGLFGIEWKLTTSAVWPDHGSMLTYTWKASDGEIAPVTPIETLDSYGNVTSVIDLDAIDAVVYHVGAYSIIDPPKFKTPGFNNNSPFIPVGPLDLNPNTGESDFLTLFPTSGVIDCNGVKYTYTGKNTFFSSSPIEGPFQARAILDWTGFNVDLYDSTSYAAWTRAIEFYKFAWLSDASHHNDFLHALIAMGDGSVWDNNQVFYKPWVTTGGVHVMELERSRFYASDPTALNTGTDTNYKVFITHGLTGVTPVDSSSNNAINSENSFVYIDEDDQVTLLGYTAISGDEDQTIAMLIDKICRVSGTKANFPGDTIANKTFTDGQSINLS